MELGATAVKGYSAFLKTPASLEPRPSHCLVSYRGHSLVCVCVRSSYFSAKMQVVYSIAPADLAIKQEVMHLRFYMRSSLSIIPFKQLPISTGHGVKDPFVIGQYGAGFLKLQSEDINLEDQEGEKFKI